MDFLKTIGGKIVTGLVALVVIAGAITWWSMDPANRAATVAGTGRIIAWFTVMLALPWVSFLLIRRVAEMGSNLAGAILVAGYTAVEAIFLAWLFDWRFDTPTRWAFLAAATLLAGVYNLFTCDWIAEKVQ